MKMTVDQFIAEVNKMEIVMCDDIIKVNMNGTKVEPIVAVANKVGGQFLSYQVPEARQFIGMSLGVYDSIQRACENAPHCNMQYRSRMMNKPRVTSDDIVALANF